MNLRTTWIIESSTGFYCFKALKLGSGERATAIGARQVQTPRFDKITIFAIRSTGDWKPRED